MYAAAFPFPLHQARGLAESGRFDSQSATLWPVLAGLGTRRVADVVTTGEGAAITRTLAAAQH
jgi:hypothetical protein